MIRREDGEVYGVQDWAEVHRLARAGVANVEIARRLGMGRNTVTRLLARSSPPVYERGPMPSMLDGHRDEIRAMLREDPQVAATVILERLRRSGYAGGISILRDFVRQVRPEFAAAAAAFQRTSYLPGEIGQVDWWHLPVRVPVGQGVDRAVLGLVVTLPHSAAHAAVFTLSKDVPAFCHALLGCLDRLGGVPEQLVFDNDTSIVASRAGGAVRLHDQVAGLFGQLAVRGVAAPPRTPQFKGQVERTIHYLENSFLPLRTFEDLADLQAQHDRWATDVAWRRHHRRVGAVVADAHRVETGWLQALPDPLPDVTARLELRVSKDGFVRTGNVDYSVPPGLAGRRVAATVSLDRIVLHLDGTVIADHARSWVPADVVVAPAHARALREHRHAHRQLTRGDVDIPAPNLAAFDALVGAF